MSQICKRAGEAYVTEVAEGMVIQSAEAQVVSGPLSNGKSANHVCPSSVRI
jgi:hypothetical protein